MDCRAARLACLVSFRSAVLLVCLQVAYAVMLTSGLLARVAPDRPIGDPYFTRMEGLVLAIMPAMICFAAGVHALTEPQRRVFSLAALVFLAVATAITLSEHGAILFLSRDPAFAGVAHVFAFEWPSVVYLLDVLA
ncbi:hypothetical protein [Ovoidimarina sediminis]|uniref:hypothetical protein n=1 Tax=Ovoidimarina sediminis TaxID=3079856 RepID=UPI0029137BA2|nr:hypothetical protein [Rhodophyticola sp. MJ-SS7]MDU8941961.1 hypothetical protein [Rhodophyticola sp. MJ-SS7]